MTPERLRRCLPGCERFEAAGPDQFAATMRLGVAIFKGTYTGSVRVVDQQYPGQLTLAVEGSGALGSLAASGSVTLADVPEGTGVQYEGEAQVGGRVAALGDGIISATARRLIELFFDCVASHVEA